MDHERIWLENEKDADPSVGRLWCKDKVWPTDSEDGEPTEYIRADIAAAARAAALEEAAKVAEQQWKRPRSGFAIAHSIRALIHKEPTP
jgi:hypothetical protein